MGYPMIKRRFFMPISYQKDYPRPQLVRSQWTNLNGNWEFAFDDDQTGEVNGFVTTFPKSQNIVVPFTYETKMSTIGDERPHNQVWYRRSFSAKPVSGERTLIHFEGVDYEAKVWINGHFAGSHVGGYARFTVDATDYLKEGENELIVSARDSFDMQIPRGKQRWYDHNYACWYVQTTGIWKTVWMETVPAAHITNIKLTPDIDRKTITVELWAAAPQFPCTVEFELSYQGKPLLSQTNAMLGKRATFCLPVDAQNAEGVLEPVHLWSPEEPALYDLNLSLCTKTSTDTVATYFGMRSIETRDGQVLLNHHPLYQRLLLDQGYWSDSHLTPPSEEALVEDIDKTIQLGYNGVRKHMKVEDERFLYWADVKGLLVWSEFPATFAFGDDAIEAFTEQWMEVVRQNYSHPSIITWTPFNESWGVPEIQTEHIQQSFTEGIYHLTKAFDPMRPVITNDGWEHTISDIITLHDYEPDGAAFLARYQQKDAILENRLFPNLDKPAFANGYAYRGQPVILSEFGGIAFDQAGEGWGYGDKVADKEAFLDRFTKTVYAIQDTPWICGFCYTQTTDVQQEINGLMTEQREFKVDPDAIAAVNRRKLRP